MRTFSKSRFSVIGYWLLVMGIQFVFGCSRPDWFVGVGGKYNEGREEVTRRQGGNLDKAIVNLEAVVGENPTYRDSLTLLGRAYYKKGRYQDAYLILQRAVAVNKEDDIAWLVLGLTQLRLMQDDKGLEAVKGGLTLLGRANADGYRGYERWDPAGKVRTSVRRAVLVARKGLEDREDLIKTVENVLSAIDEEDVTQLFEKNRTLREHR